MGVTFRDRLFSAWRASLAFPTVAVILWIPAVALAQQSARVTPADLYVLVDRVSQEVEILRYAMGKPVNSQPPMPVDDVQPHEALFQAQNLFRKANRLARELAGAQRKPSPVVPEAEIVPAHVYTTVESALQELLLVKAELAIADSASSRNRDRRKGLTDVFRAIVQVNRQLNLMTEHVLGPEDVFEQLTLAISYTAGILSAYPDTEAVPDDPLFEAGKMPADVYRRLTECLRLTRGIAETTGIKLLKFDPRREIRQDVLPSDVYDLAAIVVAYVGHLASTLDAPEAYPDLSTPKHVFPSHVYQRAGVLHEQLTLLTGLVH